MNTAMYRSLAAVLISAAVPVQGQVADSAAVDSGLLEIATAMVRATPDVTEIWPGYWAKDQKFLLLRPMDTVLLISTTPPSSDYVPIADRDLPAELRGRAFLRRDYFPGLRQNTFWTAMPLGNDTIPALEPKGSTLANRLDFYYHEAFHGFQRQRGAFAVTPEDLRTGRFGEPLVDPVHLTPAFEVAADLERRLLSRALEVEDADSLRDLIRGYTAVRRERSGANLDVIEVERRMERREGVATYVGCRAMAAATDRPPEGVRACIQEDLQENLDSLPEGPEADARLMRWRLYGTGAALALLLDELHPDWKPLVEKGMHLDQLVAQIINFDPSETERFAARAREEMLR